MTQTRKGFTLVEILIVVAIIGILASVAIVGLGPVQRRGRDTRRISDMRNAQTALELYFSKCGYYPGSAESGTTCTGGYTAAASYSAMATSITGSNLGVSKMPDDPLSGQNYIYCSSGPARYIVGAKLEDSSNQALTDPARVTDTCGSVTCGSGNWYCVTL